MAFTYNDAILADRDRVRFNINDVELKKGPRPSGGNFSDAEVDAALSWEGSWQRAVAYLYENLSGAWAKEVDANFGEQSYGRATPSAQFAAQAREWRMRYGYRATGGDTNSTQISTELTGGTIGLGYQAAGNGYS